MLKTTSSDKNLSSLIAKDTEVGSVSVSDCGNETVKKLLLTSKNSNRAIGYLTPKARLAFTQLKKTFTKAPILRHFNSEYHIQIKTDASSYAINGVFSQLTLDNLGQ